MIASLMAMMTTQNGNHCLIVLFALDFYFYFILLFYYFWGGFLFCCNQNYGIFIIKLNCMRVVHLVMASEYGPCLEKKKQTRKKERKHLSTLS